MTRTARQQIEARLGYPWPPTRELAPDQRVALKGLGLRLERERRNHPEAFAAPGPVPPHINAILTKGHRK